MATTTVAVGKLTIASRWNKPIPEGWGLDAQGRPTSDAREVLSSRLLSPWAAAASSAVTRATAWA